MQCAMVTIDPEGAGCDSGGRTVVGMNRKFLMNGLLNGAENGIVTERY